MSNLYDHVERYGHFSIRYKEDGEKFIEIYAIFNNVMADKYMMYMTRDSTVKPNKREDEDYSMFYFDSIKHAKECIDICVDREPERFI